MAGGEIVFSGMRPTGRLHLGNYWGALKNWVELSRAHTCYFCVVDWHMLTTGYEDTAPLQDNIREMALDWLAAGLDPARCVIFKQSSVAEHAELALLLGMVTPMSWLRNNPTWKDQLQELAKTRVGLSASKPESVRIIPSLGVTSVGSAFVRPEEDEGDVERRLVSSEGNSEGNYGFFGYPVLQAADILLYGGTLIPVGQDQLPHIELAREIARRFNSIYGQVFAEPKPLLTPAPRVQGTDGRKMSKSYGNGIELAEGPESLKAKIMGAYTDPKKIRATDPGHPEPCPENPPGCSIFALHKLYNSDEYGKKGWRARREECMQGRIGCVACKRDLLTHLEGPFRDFREKRESIERRTGEVERIFDEGARRARAVAAERMKRVRRAMRLA